MSWLKEQWQRLRFLKHRARLEDDLAEEMRLHLELRQAEDPQNARLRFGNVTRLREDSREAWGWPTLESILQDLRYGARTLWASPAFTLTAVLSLAVAIGANTAIFSLLNAIMLRSLPVKDPARLMNVQLDGVPSFTNPLWEQIRDHSNAFESALAYGGRQFDLSSGGDRHYTSGLMVSGDYFRTLGVPALRGRVLTTDDDKRGCGPSGPVATISYRFWQDHFDGDPSVLGRTFTLDRVAFQVVGVTPAWFTGLSKDSPYEVAIPLGCEPLFATDQSSLDQRSWWWLNIVGRLKPGATADNTSAQLAVAAPAIMRETLPPKWNPEMQKGYLEKKLILGPASTGFSALARMYGKALFTLQAVVGIVLLIACANVANLLLARATARQKELSVRLAIGAGRARIVRQLLTESLLLAILGAACGLLLAAWGTRMLLHLLNTSGTLGGGSRPEFQIDASLDLNVVAFTAAVVVLTTLFFGLLPALRASSTAPNAVLKESGRGAVAGGGGRLTLAGVMVAVQLGLAMTLLSAGLLFGESFRRILTVDPGFDMHNVVVARVEVPQALLAKPLRMAAFDEGLDRLRRIPGVRSASRSDMTPVGHWTWNDDVFPVGGQTGGSHQMYLNNVSPGYFQTLGTKLIAGRDFDSRDTVDAPRVMIISETAARKFWGDSNPIGRVIRMDSVWTTGTQEAIQVVGVVRDMKYESLSEKTLNLGFHAVSQDPSPGNSTSYELRLDSKEALNGVLAQARKELMATNKNFSLEFKTFEAQISDSLVQPRLIAAVSGVFGALALLLAATGLYGVIAYGTARRRAEIGLRMALGANSASVVWLVLRDTAGVLLAGALIGLTAAYFAARLVESLVFGVRATDPAVLGAALGVLLATAMIAAYVPARRASRQDPMEALRVE